MFRQCKWTSVNRFSGLKLKNLLEAHDVISCCTQSYMSTKLLH